MGKGGSSSKPTTQNVNQSSLPEYARPYYEEMMRGAQGLATQPYTPYGGQRIADFTGAQRWAMGNQMGAQGPSEFNQAQSVAGQAAQGSMNVANYNPQQFWAQQIGGGLGINGYGYDPAMMGAEQSNYNPNLQNYQMQNAGRVSNQGIDYNAPQLNMQDVAQSNYQTGNLPMEQMGGPGSFTSQQAQKFMNPYTQNVLDIEKREAATDAKKAQLAEDLGASRQGTYGGSRALLAGMNRERNLQQQMGDVESKGLQSAYEAARSQFNTEDAAQQAAGRTNLEARINQGQFGATQGMQQALANLDARSKAQVQNLAAQLQMKGLSAEQAMQSALANQQSELTTNQQNLQANLTTQDLGSKLGMQQALANLDARSQAQVNNQAARNQASGMSAENAMRAALANQSTGLAAQTANQQQNLEAQRLGEQSRQFGASNALAAYGQAGGLAQTLSNLGMNRFQTDQTLRDKQLSTSTMDQALQQQYLDQQYQDFLRQQGYPAEQLQQYSSLLRGVPVTPNTSEAAYRQQSSLPQQILGTGLGALGAYKSLSG